MAKEREKSSFEKFCEQIKGSGLTLEQGVDLIISCYIVASDEDPFISDC